MLIREVRETDRAFWFTLDKMMPQEQFAVMLRDQRGYVALVEDEPVAIFRYGLFWDHIPFCNLIYIKETFRRQGLGRALMRHWEQEMTRQGYPYLMTSTQADEQAQHFYRKLGYKDAGGLLLDVPGFEQPMELFLIKALRSAPKAAADENPEEGKEHIAPASPSGFTRLELEEAGRALKSTLNKCRAINMDKLPKAQQTLLSRRIKALALANELIERESAREI